MPEDVVIVVSMTVMEVTMMMVRMTMVVPMMIEVVMLLILLTCCWVILTMFVTRCCDNQNGTPDDESEFDRLFDRHWFHAGSLV